jgi:hypothetical protein
LSLLFARVPGQTKYGGISNLWRDAMQRHGQVRYHLQVGGGDQLYADRLFHLPSLQPWLKIDNHEVRLVAVGCALQLLLFYAGAVCSVRGVYAGQIVTRVQPAALAQDRQPEVRLVAFGCALQLLLF